MAGSFTSGQSFIAAQHSGDEERPFAEGPLTREDRSMTHEGILLRESPQVCPSHHVDLVSVSCNPQFQWVPHTLLKLSTVGLLCMQIPVVQQLLLLALSCVF